MKYAVEGRLYVIHKGAVAIIRMCSQLHHSLVGLQQEWFYWGWKLCL